MRRVRWAGHVAYMEKGEVYTVFWWGKPEEKYQLEDSGIDGRMIFRWILRKWDGGGARAGFIWLRIGIGGGDL